jgi:hypothetical protein
MTGAAPGFRINPFVPRPTEADDAGKARLTDMGQALIGFAIDAHALFGRQSADEVEHEFHAGRAAADVG